MADERAVARVHTRCRICGSNTLVRYLDLGVTPLANSYLNADQLDAPEPAAELALQICGKCGLSQLTRVVDRDLMFRNYLYVSSTTETFRAHCADLAARAVAEARAAKGDWVLDVASNDGLLLSCFASLGMRVFGVDPARNLAAEATARGIPTIPEYWSPAVARDAIARYGRPRAITATNVLAHVDDLHEFVDATVLALAPRGVFIVEVPYVLDFVERNEFDTAYHEHLSYFGLHPIRELFRMHGLEVFDVEHFPEIHGGTVRVFGCRAGERTPSDRSGTMLERERAFGITNTDVYLAFGERVRNNVSELARVIDGLRSGGRLIWAYGASAKGNTLMNFTQTKADAVPVVVDDNPKKWGLYTPGAHMRIVGPAELAGASVDHLLLLAWNFESEIVRRSRAAGFRGSYIRPVPAVTVFT
jgi:SAM-dependent methyltransferase